VAAVVVPKVAAPTGPLTITPLSGILPQPQMTYIAPKFGLVEVKKKYSTSGSAGANGAASAAGASRKSSTRPFGSHPSAPSVPILPPNYTAYPLSPYPLFLLDPRTSQLTASVSALHTPTNTIEELSAAAVDCTPFLLMPSALYAGGNLIPLYECLASILEFYFSPDNLVRDVYLRERMDRDRGYIAISQLLAFPRIRALTTSEYYLTVTAKKHCGEKSAKVEVAAPVAAAPVADETVPASAVSAEAAAVVAAAPAAAVLPTVVVPLFKVKNGALRLRLGWRTWVFPSAAAHAARGLRSPLEKEVDDAESSEEESEEMTQ
jgi:hypothetical protein